MQKQSLAKLAGMLCTNPQFQKHVGATNADSAAARVRQHCHIKSRRELDFNAESAKLFHELRRQFAYGGEA